MKLKKINIQGFKSFKDKVVLEFTSPIIGVVGPNGSGKSNISDAIRWVLGEQSAKSLRGTKMEDIIFAGTDKIKPLNVAQVSMTFDNSERWIPIEYKEVNITRRVFRTGESEYFINKNQCRLKDIRELFMDTGIGKEGYSIIGQGRIDDILSSKSEDRREIFEEASGISRYKYKKEETLKKLNKTMDNLSRVNDILNQQEDRVDFLEIEAKKAKQGIYLVEEIKKRELSIYKKDSEKIRLNIVNSEEKYRDSLKKLENSKQYIKDIKTEYEKTKKVLRDNEKEFELNKDNIIRLENNILNCENEIKIKKEGNKFYNNDLERISKDINNSQINKDSLINKQNKLEEEININNEKIEEIIREKLSLKTEIDSLKNELVTKQEEEKQIKFALESIIEEINSLEIKESTSESLSNNEILEIEKKKSKLISLNEKTEEETKKRFKIESNINKLNLDIDKFNNKLIDIKNKNKEYLYDKQSIYEKITYKNAKKNELDNKLSFYESIKDHYEGYYRQVSEFLKLVKKSNLKDKIIGTLAELIEVDDEYKKVINILLSSSLQNIVVKNENDAKILIEYLKKHRIGRLTFLPINSIIPRNKTANINDEKILAIASNVVKCDENLKNIIDNFLNKTLIVKDMDDAVIISKKYKNSFRIATLDGDLINTWGSIVGGFKDTNKKNYDLINRNKDIDLLKADIKKVSEEIFLLKNDLELIDIENEKNKLIEIDLLEKIDLLKEDIKLEETNLNANITNFKILEHSKDEINKDLSNNINIEIFTPEDRKFLIELRDNRNEIKQREKNLLNEILKIDNSINELNVQLVRTIGKQDTSERDILIKKNNLLDIKDTLSDFEKLNTENKYQINIVEENLRKNCEDIKLNDEKIISYKNNLDKLKENNIKLGKKLANLKEDYEKTLEKYNELNEKIIKKEYNLNLIKNNISNLIEKENEIIIEILDKYDINIIKFNIEYEDLDLNKDTLKKLKNELKNIGYFSPDSIGEYENLSKEIEFLTIQKEDLLKSREDILEIINELDEKMTKMFVESLEVINEKFQVIFRILFNGGKASIVLNDDDILNAGIDIVAEPPGKKLQNLNLLSGGERSLTAVALLFAIFETRPSPFCVLDEIDAALDEANIYRYTNYLKEISDNTQIIMITHRKSTMEIADALYGVSMEEKGISKTIVLNLEK